MRQPKVFSFLIIIGLIMAGINGFTQEKPSSKPIVNDSVFVNLDKSPKSRLGHFISYQKVGNSLLVFAEKGRLEINPYSSTILKITASAKHSSPILKSYSVTGLIDKSVAVSVLEYKDSILFQTHDIKLSLQKKSCELHFFLKGKAVLYGKVGYYTQTKNQGFDFQLSNGEDIYGLGGRAMEINHRGRILYNYNRASYGYKDGADPLNICIPNLISSKGYGLYFDNYSPSALDLGKTDANLLHYKAETGQINYFFYAGHNESELMSRYTQITGRQPLPPRWALGFIQSKFGYRSDTETVNMVDRLKRENFPLDGIVLDLYWFGGTRGMGNLDWDKKHFPQPGAFIQTLKDKGVHLIVITEPYFTLTSNTYAYLSQHGLLAKDSSGNAYKIDPFWAGPASLLDIFKPEAQDWFWKFYRMRKEEGVSGFWCDLGEPENHPFGMMHILGPARQVHNIYGLVWSKALFEKFRVDYPHERFFNLARTGYAGMQRFSVFPWSGDISRSYAGLKPQIPMMISMGLSGVAYMHSDLGGFTGEPKDPALYARWLEMGAFCPIMRAHGEGIAPEPVEYPDSVKNIVRKYIQLRYQLIPYNYTLTWKNAETGSPLVRALNYEDFKNSKLYNINDEYLWGDNFLVAPILQARQESRMVIFPAGNWIDFWGNKVYSDSATVKAKLETLPLFIKAGSFVPMTPIRSNLSSYEADSLKIRYYIDKSVVDSKYTLYNDDGHTFGANSMGAYETFLFQANFKNETLSFIVSKDQGKGFMGQKSSHDLEFIVPRVTLAPSGIKIGAKLLSIFLSENDYAGSEYGAYYNPIDHVLKIHFKWEKIPTQIKIAGIKLP